jgi:hypothetical protein
VKSYVKRQKNDAADAEAICEAVTRPNMRFVPTKTIVAPVGRNGAERLLEGANLVDDAVRWLTSRSRTRCRTCKVESPSCRPPKTCTNSDIVTAASTQHTS